MTQDVQSHDMSHDEVITPVRVSSRNLVWGGGGGGLGGSFPPLDETLPVHKGQFHASIFLAVSTNILWQDVPSLLESLNREQQ